MTAGRPSKYSKAYCEEVINTCATGLSLTAFAGDIGVARSTINKWMEEHPEFSEAVKVAKAKRTAALERSLLSAENGPTVTSRIFALKNADPDEWRDKVHQEHGVTDSLADLMREIDGKTRGLPGGR